MNNPIRTTKMLKRQTRAEFDRELAERAARADAIIAAVSIVTLVILLLVQISEKVAA